MLRRVAADRQAWEIFVMVEPIFTLFLVIGIASAALISLTLFGIALNIIR